MHHPNPVLNSNELDNFGFNIMEKDLPVHQDFPKKLDYVYDDQILSMVNEEPSQIPQDMTVYQRKFFQQPSQINGVSMDAFPLTVDKEFGPLRGSSKKLINGNEKYKKLMTIQSENMIHSVKNDKTGKSEQMFFDTKTHLTDSNKASESEESLKIIKTPHENKHKHFNGLSPAHKIKSFASKTKSMTFQFHPEKLPFPPLPSDFPIMILKFIKSKIIEEKKKEFVESFDVLLDSGAYYKGPLKFGKMHGKGKVFLQNVDLTDRSEEQEKPYLMYQGEFENNRVSGQGTLFFSGGERFEGTFRDGLAHGIGKYFIGDGRLLIQGSWVEGKYYA